MYRMIVFKLLVPTYIYETQERMKRNISGNKFGFGGTCRNM